MLAVCGRSNGVKPRFINKRGVWALVLGLGKKVGWAGLGDGCVWIGLILFLVRFGLFDR